MDRIRAGLTGLGLVFIFTLAASVLLQSGQSGEPMKSGELLAQLGVAPSSESSARNSSRSDFDPSEYITNSEGKPQSDAAVAEQQSDEAEMLAHSTSQKRDTTDTANTTDTTGMPAINRSASSRQSATSIT